MSTQRPVVGDFRSPPGNTPRKSEAAPEAPAAPAEAAQVPPPKPPAATSAPKPAPKPAPAVDDELEKELTPKERYELRLAEAGVSRTMANAIFDAVMSKDYYEEYVKVGAHRAVLRTRMYEDNLRLQTALELQRPGLVISQEDMITRYNLAASLYEWKGVAYPHETNADFDVVLNLLKRMPGPLYSLLAQKLAEFDRKVMVVFSDGATDSF